MGIPATQATTQKTEERFSQLLKRKNPEKPTGADQREEGRLWWDGVSTVQASDRVQAYTAKWFGLSAEINHWPSLGDKATTLKVADPPMSELYLVRGFFFSHVERAGLHLQNRTQASRTASEC